MKLILAIVHNDDAPIVTSELNKSDFHSTKVASTGGFLSAGNTTVITGVEDEKVDEAIRIISANCHRRTQYVPTNLYPPLAGIGAGGATAVNTVQTGGATIFVLNVENFLRV